MEENKNQEPRHGGHKHKPFRNNQNRQNAERQAEGGQRISVRPGNFNPPPRKDGEATAPVVTEAKTQQPGSDHNQNRGSQNNRHNHGRHNRNRNRPPKNTPTQQPQEKKSAATQPAEGKPENSIKNTASDRRPNRAERHHKNDRRDRQTRNELTSTPPSVKEPEISADLQSTLDEEFGTPRLSDTFSPFSATKKREETAADSEEFAVDIATADYLLDDIPSGFPIPDGKAVEVVGVRFRHAGKIYFFAPGNDPYRIGDEVLVDTARGAEIGEIVMLKRRIAEKDVIQPLRSVLRLATKEDKAHERENRVKEKEALKICADKIAYHKLDMKLVDAQYTFDNSKLLFYFTSEGRVDFRELVRDLASVFHTRIELRQIGIRDESRLIGGLGMCGRPFCCATFLSDFGQVSIKMAKEQGLSINTSKISGCCGRLMCCLRYEHETYAEESKLTPKKDTPVMTPDGEGVVIESTPLAGTVKVKLNAAPDEAAKLYHRDAVTVIHPQSSCGNCKKCANGIGKTAETALAQEGAGKTKTPAEE